jgi:hypothetical protein
MKKDFRYLGHSIVLYATDVFHWAVFIDDKPQFRSLREARNAGFAAIRTLEHAEVHEQDHV